MADLLDPSWWLRPQGGGVASSSGTLPPAMPGQTPRLPPPVSSPFSDVMGSPAFQLGYPLVASVISGLFPNRGARAIGGLSAGLNTANYFNQLQQQKQELAKQEEDKQKLGDALRAHLGGQKLVPPAPFEGQPTEGPANQVPVVADSNNKRLAQVLIDAGQPAAALKFLEAEKDKPMLNVAPGHSIVDPTNFEARFTSPAAPKQPHYFQRDLGNKIVAGYIDDQGKEVITSENPKSLAPGGQERIDQAEARIRQVESNAAAAAGLHQANLGLSEQRLQLAREEAARRAQGGGAVTETVTERGMPKSEEVDAVRASIAKAMKDEGVTDLAGANRVAKRYGFELKGKPNVAHPQAGVLSAVTGGYLGQGAPTLSGDYELLPLPTTRTTTKAPSGGGAAPAKKKDNDPLGIR